jgi:hypothetical protein
MEIFLVVAGCYIYQQLDMQWDKVNLEEVISSHQLTNVQLLCFRLIVTSIIGYTITNMLTDKKGLHLRLVNPKDELLNVHLIGIQRFSPFTCWCWSLQMLYFTLTSLLGLMKQFEIIESSNESQLLKYTIRLIWSAYEVSFSMAFLVTSVVTFGLIPVAINRKLPFENFFKVWPLLMHNFNILFITIEFFFNKLPIIIQHNILCFTWGMLYTFFSMYWYKSKGYFYYFFIDYTKPYAPIWLLVLIGIYSVFFTLGAQFDKFFINGITFGYPTLLMICFVLYIMKWPFSEATWRVFIIDLYEVFPKTLLNGIGIQNPNDSGNSSKNSSSGDQPIKQSDGTPVRRSTRNTPSKNGK